MIRPENRDPPFRVGAMFACLAAANILAWIWAFAAFADRPVLLGSALMAWVFGLRHAADVDHIAAIDNVVRKLTRAGRHAHATGLYFSLGHSTVVALACVAIAVSAAAWDLDPWKAALGGIGSAVSAVFLLLAAAMNLAALRGTWRAFRLARLGEDGAARYTVGHGAAPDRWPGSCGNCLASSAGPGICIRWDFYSGWGSTRPPRSVFWPWRPPRRCTGCHPGR